MSLKTGEVFKRITPEGDRWDSVRVGPPSPTADDEFVVAPVDPFAGDSNDELQPDAYDVEAREVIALSTSEDALRSEYEPVSE